MIKITDIKNGNIVNFNGRQYMVEVNSSTGDIKLIFLPTIEHIEINFVVTK